MDEAPAPAPAEEEEEEDDDEEEPGSRRKAKPRRWTDAEDAALCEAVRKYGERTWKSIAQAVGTRDHMQCLQRWKKVIKPGLVRGRWSAREDAIIRNAVENHGDDIATLDWNAVAAKLDVRSARECRDRWKYSLSALAVHRPRSGEQPEQDDREPDDRPPIMPPPLSDAAPGSLAWRQAVNQRLETIYAVLEESHREIMNIRKLVDGYAPDAQPAYPMPRHHMGPLYGANDPHHAYSGNPHHEAPPPDVYAAGPYNHGHPQLQPPVAPPHGTRYYPPPSAGAGNAPGPGAYRAYGP